MMKTAMTIAGVDSGGGAGIAADLKTFAALGVHGTCIVTSVTAQNTEGVKNFFDIPSAFIEEQFGTVVSDIKIDCVKTGMLSSPEIVETVAHLIKRQRLPLVIDPVMAAGAGGTLLKDEAVKVMIDGLLPLSKVVTPNVREAERLSGIRIKDMQGAKKAAIIISEFGPGAVIVTGGHLEGTDVLYFNGEYTSIEGTLIKGGSHGSGCTHSAAITAELSKGATIVEAARTAKDFVEKAISKGIKIGKGAAPVNQMAYVKDNAERFRVLKNLEKAVEMIQGNQDFSDLIPEVGCNIAMGIPDATSVSDIAAVSGRIVRLKNKPHAVGCIAFGASSHVARIVLTSMKYDEKIRAAMNIRYSIEALQACKYLGLAAASFDRGDEPEGVSTMEWGVSTVMGREDRVPGIIYDEGDVGKEAMIRLLGKDAVEVAGRALKIAEAMEKNC